MHVQYRQPRGRTAILMAALSAVLAFAQSDSQIIQPLRTTPTEKLTVNLGFRDWSPATLAGNVLLAGNQTGRGGLFAVDTVSGKMKWSNIPSFSTGTASLSTPPAVAGGLVIVPYATAYPGAVVAVSLATGKEVWRGLDPVQGAAVAVNAGLAYIFAKNGTFYALDAATGREKWKVSLSNRAGCASRPIVRNDVIYFTGNVNAIPDPTRPQVNYLFALDARTGQERWRYRAEAPYVHDGVCLHQPVVTADAIYATGERYLYSIDLLTGRDRWKPIEVRRQIRGETRTVEVFSLVDAGAVFIANTPTLLIAFEKNSGRTAWELAGQFTDKPMAVVGDVLYFQGSPADKPAVSSSGTLHALDLNSHSILWSFSRPTAEANWSFGSITPTDRGLWVDSYKAIVKLQ